MSNGTDSWNYTYDNAGNITAITSGGKRISYQYDKLNQLIRENSQSQGGQQDQKPAQSQSKIGK